jgi:phosphotriesterase-related protein
MEILSEERVRPDAFIWVHAESDRKLTSRVEAARRGAWIEIDNISENTVPETVDRVNGVKQQGLLNRLLVSHDAGWYKPGQPRGGRFRGFETANPGFVPAYDESAGPLRRSINSW